MDKIDKRAEDFKRLFGKYPSGYKTPAQRLKDAMAQTNLNLATNPTRKDTLDYNRQHPGKPLTRGYKLVVPETGDTLKFKTPTSYLAAIKKLKEKPKTKTAKQLYDEKLYTLRLKQLNGTITPDELARLNKITGKKTSKSTDLAGIKKKLDLARAIQATPADSLDAQGNPVIDMGGYAIPSKVNKKYPEALRQKAAQDEQTILNEQKWQAIANEYQNPIDEIKSSYQKAIDIVLPLLEQQRNAPMFTEKGFEQYVNKKLLENGITNMDYEDFINIDRALGK